MSILIESKMKKITAIILLLLIIAIQFSGCKKDDPDSPQLGYVNITINPNSTFYQEINIVGGWTYLGYNDGVREPSRGIIVYRSSVDLFMAYDRTPPYKPDSCCNGYLDECTALLVDSYYPFAMDTCTNSKFLLLDGSPVEGPSPLSMIFYRTSYDGQYLHIFN